MMNLTPTQIEDAAIKLRKVQRAHYIQLELSRFAQRRNAFLDTGSHMLAFDTGLANYRRTIFKFLYSKGVNYDAAKEIFRLAFRPTQTC